MGLTGNELPLLRIQGGPLFAVWAHRATSAGPDEPRSPLEIDADRYSSAVPGYWA
jgi:hypothetical protein